MFMSYIVIALYSSLNLLQPLSSFGEAHCRIPSHITAQVPRGKSQVMPEHISASRAFHTDVRKITQLQIRPGMPRFTLYAYTEWRILFTTYLMWS